MRQWLQIDDKGYLLSYTADGRRVAKVGVAFDVEKESGGMAHRVIMAFIL